MNIRSVFFRLVLLIFAGMSFSGIAQAGKGNTETVVSLPPDIPENINSQQESFSVCKYPLFLVNKLRDTIGIALPTKANTQLEFNNYPWAIKPTRSICSRSGCSGVIHRHRKYFQVASLSTVGIGAISTFGFAGLCIGVAFPLNSIYLALGSSCGAYIGAAGVCTGFVGWLKATSRPIGKLASRLYQCNHEQCIEVPRLKSDDVIDEQLRCPGNNEYLLRYPVMISGYEQPLSLEFVLQCIRDKTPFPQETSTPVKPDRIIKWKDLSSSQQNRIRTVYEGSQEWLRQNRPQDLSVSVNGKP